MTCFASRSSIPNPAEQLQDPQNGQRKPHGIGTVQPQCHEGINAYANAPLNTECTDENQKVQSRTGTTREFLWKWLVASGISHDAGRNQEGMD